MGLKKILAILALLAHGTMLQAADLYSLQNSPRETRFGPGVSGLVFPDSPVDLRFIPTSGGTPLKIGCSGYMTQQGKKRVLTFEIGDKIHQMDSEDFQKMLRDEGMSEEEIQLIQDEVCEDDGPSKDIDASKTYSQEKAEKLKIAMQKATTLLEQRSKNQSLLATDRQKVQKIWNEHQAHLAAEALARKRQDAEIRSPHPH
jgi:hypothetical protein